MSDLPIQIYFANDLKQFSFTVTEFNFLVAFCGNYDKGWLQRNPNSIPDFVNDFQTSMPIIFAEGISIVKSNKIWVGRYCNDLSKQCIHANPIIAALLCFVSNSPELAEAINTLKTLPISDGFLCHVNGKAVFKNDTLSDENGRLFQAVSFKDGYLHGNPSCCVPVELATLVKSK